MNKKINVILGLNNYNVIEFAVLADEELDYERHLSTRVFNMLGIKLFMLELYIDENIKINDEIEQVLDVNLPYVLYVDTLYANNGFFRAKLSSKKKATPSDLYDIIPKEFLNSLLLTVGEENFWMFLENAGYKIFYINPKEQTMQALKQIAAEASAIRENIKDMYYNQDKS